MTNNWLYGCELVRQIDARNRLIVYLLENQLDVAMSNPEDTHKYIEPYQIIINLVLEQIAELEKKRLVRSSSISKGYDFPENNVNMSL